MSEVDLKFLAGIMSVLLGLNLYFLKEILKHLATLQAGQATLITQNDHNVKMIDKNNAIIYSNSRQISECRERIHKLEGGQAQILKHLDL